MDGLMQTGLREPLSGHASSPECVHACSDGRSGDMVISLAIMSNPQIINATSVLFPVVSNQANSNQKPSSMAAFYEGSEPHMDMGRGYVSASHT